MKKKCVPVNNKVITTSTIPFAACGNLSVFDARIIHEIINNNDALIICNSW